MKAVKKAGTIVLSVILWVIILLAALFAIVTLTNRDPMHVSNVAGFTPMVVETDSMSPTFNAGDLILIRSCDPAELQEGDIITFHTIIMNEYALNTHRIAAIEDMGGVRSYTTKGDNNAIADTHIIADGDIVGKYVGRAPGLGKVMNVLSSSIGFLLIIVLPMLLFFIYQVYHLIMVAASLKKASAVEAAVEAAERAAEVSAAREGEAEALRAETERLRKEAEEARAALAEAQRLKAEAEAVLNASGDKQE